MQSKIIMNQNILTSARAQGINLRPAIVDDYQQIVECIVKSFSEIKDLPRIDHVRLTGKINPRDQHLAQDFQNVIEFIESNGQDCSYIVATKRSSSEYEELVGVCIYEKMSDLENPKQTMLTIHYLSVLPSSQKNGIGSYLLSTVLYDARMSGCKKFIVSPTESSMRLYEKFGFKKVYDGLKFNLQKNVKFSLPFFDHTGKDENIIIKENNFTKKLK